MKFHELSISEKSLGWLTVFYCKGMFVGNREKEKRGQYFIGILLYSGCVLWEKERKRVGRRVRDMERHRQINEEKGSTRDNVLEIDKD